MCLQTSIFHHRRAPAAGAEYTTIIKSQLCMDISFLRLPSHIYNLNEKFIQKIQSIPKPAWISTLIVTL